MWSGGREDTLSRDTASGTSPHNPDHSLTLAVLQTPAEEQEDVKLPLLLLCLVTEPRQSDYLFISDGSDLIVAVNVRITPIMVSVMVLTRIYTFSACSLRPVK